MKKITLALAALALLNAGSAYAAGISANIGPVGASVGAGLDLGGSNVLSYPAVMEGSTILGAPTVLSYPASYDGTDACATPCAPVRRGLLSRLFHRDLLSTRSSCLETISYSAVIPGNVCGVARGLNGERIGNPLFDVSLFKFGLRAGVVNPRWDMRPVGF